jgi:hypothetical protein
MLNIVSDIETAVGARAGSGTGALLRPGVAGSTLAGTADVVFARPRAIRATDAFGQRRTAAQAVGLGQCSTRKQNLNMTRIAAPSGGAMGSHPPREPV